MAAAFFLEYMAALSLGSIFSGTLFGMCRRQIFQLGEAAELTFTEHTSNTRTEGRNVCLARVNFSML